MARFGGAGGRGRLGRATGRLRGRGRGRRRGVEGVREAGRARCVLRVPVGRPSRQHLRVRHPVLPPHHDDPGVHAGARGGLRLRRGFEGDARRTHVGRRAPPRPERDRRQLRRALAVHQRHGVRPHRPHRPRGLQDQADLRADPEPVGRARVPVPDPEHRVRVRGVALLGAGAEPPGAESRTTPGTSAASPASRWTRRTARCRWASRS